MMMSQALTLWCLLIYGLQHVGSDNSTGTEGGNSTTTDSMKSFPTITVLDTDYSTEANDENRKMNQTTTTKGPISYEGSKNGTEQATGTSIPTTESTATQPVTRSDDITTRMVTKIHTTTTDLNPTGSGLSTTIDSTHITMVTTGAELSTTIEITTTASRLITTTESAHMTTGLITMTQFIATTGSEMTITAEPTDITAVTTLSIIIEPTHTTVTTTDSGLTTTELPKIITTSTASTTTTTPGLTTTESTDITIYTAPGLTITESTDITTIAPGLTTTESTDITTTAPGLTTTESTHIATTGSGFTTTNDSTMTGLITGDISTRNGGDIQHTTTKSVRRHSSKYFSASELLLLIGVCFASFLLILSAFVILAVTLVIVVRRKSGVTVNMITVHNYGNCSNCDSDIESIDEEQSRQIHRVQETANEEISVNITINHDHESNLEHSKPQNLMRDHENEVVKLDLKETMTTIANETDYELTTVVATDSEPKIVSFDPLVKAKEGEQVILHVNFTGTPKPTITWSFKSIKMEGDYATELSTDGSLMFFCVEPKHAGKYDFEIKNDLGTVQASVTLDIEEDIPKQQHTQAIGVIEKTNNLESNPIAKEKFREYVAGLHLLNNKAFEIQYKSLLSGEEGKQVSIGRSDEFRGLNRFRNITAYDDCRIILEPITGCQDYQHDYINASYVDGLSKAKMFIATQGPLPHTIIDFWRLIWQEKVKTIAMVTNLREGIKVKCEQYWPEQGQEMQIGPYMVTNVKQQSFPYFDVRKILLKYTAAGIAGIAVSREVTQYHYTSWPDHGVPECPSPILSYLRRIKAEHKTDDGPILVHCSAGVGRTGTLIAIDIALSQASKEKQVDIPKIVVNLRRQRMKMVQTVNQYVFVHDAVLEALICGDTQILNSNLHQAVERLKQKDERNGGKTGFEQQFEILEQVSPKPLEVVRSSALRHSDKNRSNNFLPPDKWRVRLKGRSPGQDYIHASYAHGYKQRKAFIIAQSPMVSTVGDFVKMLYEKECGVVVMLCGCEEGGVEMCAQYWPTTIDTTMKHEELLVSTMKVTERDGITQRLITITDSKSDKAEPYKVTQFQVEQWNTKGVCSNTQALIDILNQIREIQKNVGNTPVVVHGSDTVSRVGVFCSLVNAIEMCKTEGVVDLFQIIKALRIQKPGAVLNANQYGFIFDTITGPKLRFPTCPAYQNMTFSHISYTYPTEDRAEFHANT